MLVDQIGNTSESPLERLEKVGMIENQPVSSLETLKGLATLGVRTGREYGVQVYETYTDRKQRWIATYVKGARSCIREPEKPEGVSRGVFFHTHSGKIRLLDKVILRSGKTPWYMLPSDRGMTDILEQLASGQAGDIVANFNRRLGGYLNITSSYGLSLHIGVTENPSNKDLQDSQWEVLVGREKGRIYTPEKLFTDRSYVPDPVMLWRQRWPRSKSNFFLLLSWDKVHELAPVFTDLNNLCFGDGVARVAQSLQLDIPYQKNLADVTKVY